MIKNYQLCDGILIIKFGGGFMKNPNGFGTVTKLSGKRRKPWVAKVTVGFDSETGKQIQKSIGTFETRADAMKQLSLYHVSKEDKNLALEMDPKNARNIQKKARISHTFEECVRGAIEREKDGKSKSWINARNTSIKFLCNLMPLSIDEISIDDIQSLFDSGTQYSLPYLSQAKVTCNMAFRYAIMKQWVRPEDDFMRYIKIKSKSSRKILHRPFTIEEIKRIKMIDDIESKLVMVYLFTGCRASELLDVSEIHEEYIVCGLKTESGRKRKIPVHPIIKPYYKEIIRYLDGKNYKKLSSIFQHTMEKYGMDHTLHDTRYTFATLGKEFNMKPSAVKKIMGHKSKDLTDDVYTHESIKYLKNEIEKIVIN